jgi:hypothetical protein
LSTTGLIGIDSAVLLLNATPNLDGPDSADLTL